MKHIQFTVGRELSVEEDDGFMQKFKLLKGISNETFKNAFQSLQEILDKFMRNIVTSDNVPETFPLNEIKHFIHSYHNYIELPQERSDKHSEYEKKRENVKQSIQAYPIKSIENPRVAQIQIL